MEKKGRQGSGEERRVKIKLIVILLCYLYIFFFYLYFRRDEGERGCWEDWDARWEKRVSFGELNCLLGLPCYAVRCYGSWHKETIQVR